MNRGPVGSAIPVGSAAGRNRWPHVLLVLLLVGAVIVFAFRREVRAEEGDDEALEDHACLVCHGFPDNEDGAPHVDGHGYLATAHAKAEVDCVACHENHEDYPHPKDEPVLTMQCGECHDEVFEELAKGNPQHAELLGDDPEDSDTTDGCVQCHSAHVLETTCTECHEDIVSAQARSVHAKKRAVGDMLAPRCSDCHDAHRFRSPDDPTSPVSIFNIPETCGKCHKEESPVSEREDISEEKILRNYTQSLHGHGLFDQGLTVTAVCTSCHTAHDILPHTDPRSSVHQDRVVQTCLKCHGRIETVHQKVIEGRLWEEEPGKIPVCVDCHAPHAQRLKWKEGWEDEPPTAVIGVQDTACLRCHASESFKGRTMLRDGEEVGLYLDWSSYATAVHHQVPHTCAQCHVQVTPSPEERHCETITSPVDCSSCHAEQVELHHLSAHGHAGAGGDPDAPTCLDCHEKHAMLSKKLPISPTFPRNVPSLCGKCHRDGERAAERIETSAHIVESYVMSIHGKGLDASGLLVTATCVNCHTAHHPLLASDPESSVHDANVADTCGQCHHGIEEQFKTSIHWPGNGNGDKPLPTCKHCHTSHEISRADTSNFRLQMTKQCGDCHDEETRTFFDTVHGQSSLLKSERSAKCYDCHGSHQILPPSNPVSKLSRENVVATCAQCHQTAHRQFAGYLTHATHHDPHTYPWLFWTFWGMTALLLGTLAVALTHTGAWLVRLWLTRDEWMAHKAKSRAVPGQKMYRRFDRYQRMQHLIMLVSFFVLAITGMALKFSYTTWAQALASVIGFDAMSNFHRLGAVVLFGVFFVHLEYVRRKRKRLGLTWKQMFTGPSSIVLNLHDLKEAKESIKWFFGKGPRPHYGRYTYWEKFDYLAVFWGVAVIGFTGLLRWFPEFFTHIVPGWFINVAAIIHSDEALLAVGFIFTIHFFNTHFRPDKFPMDPVIFTGRITIDEFMYDKPREYQYVVANDLLERRLVDPVPQGTERASRIFGFTMLGIGLLLIALIVIAMIWGYK